MEARRLEMLKALRARGACEGEAMKLVGLDEAVKGKGFRLESAERAEG